MRIVIIDNFDSFTHNIVNSIARISNTYEVSVHRADVISCLQVEALKPDMIIISPGPGHPKDAKLSLEIIQYFAGKIPIIGICLGHQAIGYAYGGEVVKTIPVHGKISDVYHNQKNLFSNIKSPFKVTRYHSLAIKEDTISANFTIDAKTSDGVIMAISWPEQKLYGLQFHPESIATEESDQLFRNILNKI